MLSWEKGKFKPRGEKKATLVALRKLKKRGVRKLLEEKVAAKATPAKEPAKPRRKAQPRKLARRAKPAVKVISQERRRPATRKLGRAR